ncbi:sensor domain-containing diguanylate cyclase [Shewanella sp. 1_MG-2023]|uniref:sensor domain-containing diguanylate cyclase n=1 Tax=unclassified Shewanella TaxID=196818 RepID=UPI0026E11FCA|nr:MULTISPECIES: sensor domain-containing diguanylate cyclase [unclassified Shewanella]MDO6611442.1 sensor domain-containing diguanylate cyclase [Shewanella sp. 7_MG-2023]MDO6771297.1 sensor domain-containing diguanylate cyclase [Shewanella sp. 2_MG-2023]MDO6793523.1 sensor domain-containing diguanylate cyclase [Shewanella sp. 1_MG-2023]
MLTAPIRDNEEARLQTLRNLNVLDTAAEERFDRITRLAKRLFSVSICLVSLVDENRQWFKSCQGLVATETPRDISFCGHAIHHDGPFVINDASADPRFSDNPLVTQAPHIRFYTGHPLTMPNGMRVGTLCIIDDKPREFGEEDQVALKDLAEMVVSELVSIQQTTLDELTGISNRRGFEVLANQAMATWDRNNVGSCLVFFDLDFFKEINDSHGHDAGDRALKSFANLLTQEFRDSDVIARFGGDEFLVLFCECNDGHVTFALERFKRALKVHNATSNEPFELAYSVGFASRKAKQELDVIQYLELADKEMYQVKALHHHER